MNRIRANRMRRCPACDHDTWCLIAADGSDVICARVSQGGKEIKSRRIPGAYVGYLHKLTTPIAPVPRLQHPKPKAAPGKAIDFEGMARDYIEDIDGKQLLLLHKSLKVSVASLHRMQIGWTGRAWSFPMCDGAGRVIGIRLRTADGKRKFAVTGGSNGLFIPHSLTGSGPLLLPEGPTDTAALLDLGFDAIGRPMAIGCEELLITCPRLRRRAVVIVADNDKPDQRGIQAGIDGAERLAAKLGRIAHSVKIVMPTWGKDARQWINDGMSRRGLTAVINNANLVGSYAP